MPKRTFQPNIKKKKRRQGFRAKMRTIKGRVVIKRRIRHKRKRVLL